MCGDCGGSFYEPEGRSRLRCSWHHDRGDAVCSSQLMVRRGEMEERVLGAIEAHVLEPDAVLYVVERTLAIVEQELAADVDREALMADRRRLAEIQEEAARGARLMVKRGIAESAAEELLAELEVERSTLEQQIARAEGVAPAFDREALRPLVEEYARDLGKTFDGSGAAGNRALRALLGDRRIGVYAGEERGFRLEGEFELTGLLNEHCAQPGSTERSVSLVVGAGFDPSETPGMIWIGGTLAA